MNENPTFLFSKRFKIRRGTKEVNCQISSVSISLFYMLLQISSQMQLKIDNNTVLINKRIATTDRRK